jgi:hypothetical protein
MSSIGSEQHLIQPIKLHLAIFPRIRNFVFSRPLSILASTLFATLLTDNVRQLVIHFTIQRLTRIIYSVKKIISILS